MRKLLFFFFLTIILLPLLAAGDCSCEDAQHDGKRSRSIPLKLIAIFTILIAGAAGICLLSLGKWISALRPERSFFFAIKAFAAGVILATSFIHILPNAFESLTSPCLNPSPWHEFPFAGFFAMVSAIGTLSVDSAATGYYSRVHPKALKEIVLDEEKGSNPSGASDVAGKDLIRHQVISQVLELGIVVHSVIVGISLGASSDSSSIKPIVIALSFHQFFEGMGLGGCLIQAQYKIKSMISMIVFFSLTTPVGIGIGIGISSVYDDNSPSALIVEGILESGAAGILIYMALVDLLAADFNNSKVQNNGQLQFIINIFLLMGAGLMSLLAKWT